MPTRSGHPASSSCSPKIWTRSGAWHASVSSGQNSPCNRLSVTTVTGLGRAFAAAAAGATRRHAPTRSAAATPLQRRDHIADPHRARARHQGAHREATIRACGGRYGARRGRGRCHRAAVGSSSRSGRCASPTSSRASPIVTVEPTHASSPSPSTTTLARNRRRSHAPSVPVDTSDTRVRRRVVERARCALEHDPVVVVLEVEGVLVLAGRRPRPRDAAPRADRASPTARVVAVGHGTVRQRDHQLAVGPGAPTRTAARARAARSGRTRCRGRTARRRGRRRSRRRRSRPRRAARPATT